MDPNELYGALYEEIKASPGQSSESLVAKFPNAHDGDVGMVLRTLGSARQIRYIFDACCGHNGYFIYIGLGADVGICKVEKARRSAEEVTRRGAACGITGTAP